MIWCPVPRIISGLKGTRERSSLRFLFCDEPAGAVGFDCHRLQGEVWSAARPQQSAKMSAPWNCYNSGEYSHFPHVETNYRRALRKKCWSNTVRTTALAGAP